jgi:hypothetical protein
VRCGVLFAFGPTSLADHGAEFDELANESSVAGYERGRQPTNRGALSVEHDAITHHIEVIFAKTRGSATIAGDGASVASGNAARVIVVGHA